MFLHYSRGPVLAVLVLLGVAPTSQAERQDLSGWRALASSIDETLPTLRGYKSQEWPGTLGDEAFLDRVSRDLVGRAPTPDETRTFTSDRDPGKRSRAIDRLLDSEDYGKFWADRWMMILFEEPLRNPRRTWLWKLDPKAEEKLRGSFRRWLQEELNRDQSWAKIVYRILNARGKASTEPALAYKIRFFRAGNHEVEYAQAVSRNFMGIRLECAVCHDHPFDRWRVEDTYGMAAWAVRTEATLKDGDVEVREKAGGEMKILPSPDANNKNSKVRLAQGGIAHPKLLVGGFGGPVTRNLPGSFARLVTLKANLLVPQALANRAWGHLFGRGLIHPVDDFNMRNRALSRSLLEVLTRGVVEGDYSLKHLLRGITNSRLYQQKDSAVNPGEARLVRRMVPHPNVVLRPPPLKFDMPEDWRPLRVGEYRGNGHAYDVPRKAGDADPATFRLTSRPRTSGDPIEYRAKAIEGRMERFKRSNSTLEGRVDVRLMELRGLFSCDLRISRTIPYRILYAEIPLDGKRWFASLRGPENTVEWWRKDFITLVKSLAPANE